MFIVPADQMLLPLAIIDVSAVRSDRPTSSDKATRRRSTRVAETIEANIVRLIPGVTRLPLGLSPR